MATGTGSDVLKLAPGVAAKDRMVATALLLWEVD